MNQFSVLRQTKRRRSSSELQEDISQRTKINEDEIVELSALHQSHFQQITLINRFPISHVRENNLITCDGKDKCIIGLKFGESWCFIGRCSIRVLKGSVEVYGALLSPSSPIQHCFSPTSHAPLNFHSRKAVDVSESDNQYDQYESVLELSILDRGLFKFEQNPFYGSLFKPSNNHIADELIPGLYSVSYNTTEICQLMPPLFCPPMWYQFVHEKLLNTDDVIKIAVLGSKNNGKSTFCKFLINQLLQNHETVCYLETDVGQPEFTPSGLLALNEISSPRLGPSYTHIDMQETRFFGYTSPEKNPALYFSLIVDLFNVYVQKYRARNIPLIINTHGWIKSIGLDLLNQILQLTMPGFIVQFVGANADGQMKNFDIVASKNSELKTRVFNEWSLDDDNIDKSVGDLQQWNYESILFPPPVSELNMKSSKWSAADIRTLRFMFYFANAFDNNNDRIWDFTPLTEMIPKFIELGKINTNIGNDLLSDDELLRVLNASIVGLMSESSLKCHGLAIVRAVTNEQSEKKGIYLLSPLSTEELNDMDMTIFHRHNDEIPTAMLFKDTASIKTSPYCETFVIDGIQGHKMRKTRRNLLRKYHS